MYNISFYQSYLEQHFIVTSCTYLIYEGIQLCFWDLQTFYKMQNRMQSCAYNLFGRKNSLSIIKLLSFLCYCKLLEFHHNSTRDTICIKLYIPNLHFNQVFKHFLEVISLQAIVISAQNFSSVFAMFMSWKILASRCSNKKFSSKVFSYRSFIVYSHSQSLQIYYSFQYVLYPLFVFTDPSLDPLQVRLSNVVQ